MAKIKKRIKQLHNNAKIFSRNASDGHRYIFIDCGHEGGWRRLYWRNVIYEKNIKPLLHEAGILSQIEFELGSRTSGDESFSSKLTYSNAAVYLADIGAVEDVARMVREGDARLGVDKYVENAYKWIHQTAQLSALILGVVVVCAFFLCTVNIFLMFYQTVLRKRHEIGILKAFGCSGLRIANIFFLESFYISLVGCVLGLFMGWYVGDWAGNTLTEIYELKVEYGVLFYLNWQIVGYILLFVFLLCESITYLATFKTTSKTANELLRQRD